MTNVQHLVHIIVSLGSLVVQWFLIILCVASIGHGCITNVQHLVHELSWTMNSHMCDIWKMGHENLLDVLNACMGPMLRDLCKRVSSTC